MRSHSNPKHQKTSLSATSDRTPTQTTKTKLSLRQKKRSQYLHYKQINAISSPFLLYNLRI
ncbi:hypothetical protein [Brunnivagina elsteri]|uniref:hypothetical protein n=1 Tax=Brunnivagina elsteri TaxID=1247191 RepID=UPI001B80627E|nr:hypothetical protein [Calothrix elsteri]